MNKHLLTPSVKALSCTVTYLRQFRVLFAGILFLFAAQGTANAQCQTCCNGSKPKTLVMQYNGLSCSETVTCQAAGKWSCSGGGPNGAGSVYITATKNSDGSGGTYFAGTVALNAEFTVNSASGGSNTFPANTYFRILSSQGGTLLQTVGVHTSCSTPLVAGDQLGSIKIKKITLADNTSCNDPTPPPVPCTVSITGTNSICQGQGTTLTAAAAVAGSSYLWSNGATTASITVTPTATSTYSVTATKSSPVTFVYSSANFSYINSTNQFAGPANLFNGVDDTGTASFHANRTTSGQTWGIKYQLGGQYRVTGIGVDRRNDVCCTERGEGGVMQVYKSGALVYQSSVLSGTGNGVLNASPALSNVVGDEVRYVFLNGANTLNNDGTLNFAEWIIGIESVCEATSSASVTVGNCNLCTTRTVSNLVNLCGSGPAHGFYGNGLVSGLSTVPYYALSNTSWKEYDDGTAIFTGTATNTSNSNVKFDMNIQLSGRTSTPPTGSPKGADCYTINPSQWYYYQQMSGTLTGQSGIAGGLIQVSLFNNIAFQIGQGGTIHDPNVFGGGAWLDYSVVSQPTAAGVTFATGKQMDLNFQLSGAAGDPCTCTNLGATVSISGTNSICQGSSTTLTATSNIAGSTFLWSTGATTASITVTPAATTTYSVTATKSYPASLSFNAANFSFINSTNDFGGPASLFNGVDDTNTGTFHANRTTSGQTWGIGYKLGGLYKVTGIGIDRRNDCCTDRGEGGVMQVYKNGALVYQSSALSGTGDGILNAAPALSNVVGDEVRYVFLNGANTLNNDASLNFTEWIIGIEGLCDATSSLEVTVNASPAISAQPTGSTLCSGGTATLSVTATGGIPSLAYQWQSSSNNSTFTNIAGATGSSYTTPALTATTYYRAVVSATGSGCGSVTSSSATVTVNNCNPCATQGGDSDGDGICNNQDCQPNNPAYPATPGTTCNDGNPNTTNDVVQADGCSCAGTPTGATLCTTRTVTNSASSCGTVTAYGFYAYTLISGATNDPHYSISNATLKEYDNGTAIYTAEATNVSNANVKFNISITLSGRTSTAPSGSPKTSSCYTINPSQWYYYTQMDGTLTGLNSIAGGSIKVSLLDNIALQVGTGANLNDASFLGASSWLAYTITSQPTTSGVSFIPGMTMDINIRLSGAEGSPCPEVMPAPTHPKFVNALPNIPRIDATNGGTYNIGMEESSQWLGLQTANGTHINSTVWGYTFNNHQMYLGPTFVAKKDVPVDVKWINNLGTAHHHLLPVDHTIHMAHPTNGVATVVHLHGGHTEAESDGYPDAWFTQGWTETGAEFKKQTYHYSNDQEAAPLWYHDHALGITRLNVYAGLAGMYLLRDNNELSLSLPTGNYERELVIQDKQFAADGSLYFPALLSDPEAADFPTDPNIEPTIFPEFFGDYILVNGMTWPKLDVQPTKYRFRLLNASDSRFYIFKLSNNKTFQQIGTDGGLLNSPVTLTQLVLAPGERADIVIDFTGLAGQSITLLNVGPDMPFMGLAANQMPADPATTGQIMRFNVAGQATATFNIPATLRQPIQYLGAEVKTRQVLLLEGMDQYGRLMPSLGTAADGALAYVDPVTETPNINEIEVWEVYNNTGDAHPIHLHQQEFQLVNRQEFTGDLDPVTSKLTNIQLVGSPIPPAANEQGWKDTYIVPPGQMARYKVRFDLPGKYVWHCHILSHEDHDMMRPFEVMPSSGGTGNCSNIVITPSAGKITVSGLNGSPVSSLQVFNSSYSQQLFNCFGNCNGTETVSLGAGSYNVIAKYYDASWMPVCEKTMTVNISQALADGQSQDFKFDAFKYLEHAELVWLHKGDHLVNQYILERSADGQDFEEIFSQPSKKDAAADVYEGYDFDPLTGMNYYRVKMLNEDGSVSYSEVKALEYKDLIDFALFPNPANQYVDLNLETVVGKNVSIEVFDNLGINVLAKEIGEVTSKYHRLDIRPLKEGHYIVWIQVEGRRPVARQLFVGKL